MNGTPRIVVGVDGFESSKAALRWAIHQAKLTGAVVDAVTAWQIPAGSALIPAADLPDYQDDARIILTEAEDDQGIGVGGAVGVGQDDET